MLTFAQILVAFVPFAAAVAAAAGVQTSHPASSWAAESPCHQTDPSVVVVVAVVAGAVASLETGWGMPACPYLAAVPAVAAWGVLGTL